MELNYSTSAMVVDGNKYIYFPFYTQSMLWITLVCILQYHGSSQVVSTYYCSFEVVLPLWRRWESNQLHWLWFLLVAKMCTIMVIPITNESLQTLTSYSINAW